MSSEKPAGGPTPLLEQDAVVPSSVETCVLVIEDNLASLELMRYLLSAYGYCIREALDGETGLHIARTKLVHVVVCDIQLPALDGYALAGIFKRDSRLRQIPLVAVTALAMVGDRDRILGAGFDGYIAKPIEAASFVGRVESYLPQELRSSGWSRPPEAPQEPVVVSSGRTLATVLVVDDTATNVDVLKCVLEPSGFRVLSACDGDTAMSILADVRPDLIIADLHLKAEKSFSFLDRVRAEDCLAEVPVIYCSSTSSSPRLAAEARRRGAQCFLFRPVAPQALLEEVRSCLKLA